jgi:hypothetical protein
MSKTVIVTLTIDDLEMFSPEWMKIWNKTFELEKMPEKHSPQLYAVWAQKQDFVMRAMKLDPFRSNYFVWMDAGLVRDKMMVETTPRPFELVPELIGPQQLGFLEIDVLGRDLVEMYHQKSKALTRHSYYCLLGGGIIVGDKDAWRDFSH